GNAIRTDPPAGATVDRGTTVTLYVSTGPAPRTIPAVAGESRADTLAALRDLKLRATEGPAEFSDDIPAGAAVRTNPPAGGKVSRGAAVQVIFSKGPELVAVPNVIGRSLAAARRQLEAAGFTVAVKSLFGQSNGTVLGQSPLPLTRVRPGSTVTVGIL